VNTVRVSRLIGRRGRGPRRPTMGVCWNDRLRAMRFAQFICCLPALLFAFAGFAGESVDLRLLPAPDRFFESAGSAPNTAPPEGNILVFGLFNDPRLSIEGIDRITVVAGDGTQIPLTIEKDSVFYEFDRIVSLRFYFLVDADSADDPETRFTLSWGSDVAAKNTEVAKVALDPESRSRTRGFQWGNADISGGVSGQVAQIEVIADSSAGYYFLWYLLPMAMIFALLTIRKLTVRRPAQ